MEEGADMLMVKPGMAYLDIVRDVKERVSDSCEDKNHALCMTDIIMKITCLYLNLFYKRIVFHICSILITHWLYTRYMHGSI